MKRRVKRKRGQFALTPTEAKVLALVRSGLTHAEIERLLGHKPHRGMSVGALVGAAVDKERLASAIFNDGERGEGSSLSKARGAVRMKGTK